MMNLLFIFVIGGTVIPTTALVPCIIFNPCQQICDWFITAKCSCKVGYTISSFDKTKCDDINECQTSQPCGGAKCTNQIGSYTCSCGSGYRSIDGGRQCVDIDECQSSPCQHNCRNTVGSFRCSCRSGYEPSPTDPRKCVAVVNCEPGYQASVSNPGQCEDINECETTRPCQHNCKNTDGGYRCSCNVGYEVTSGNINLCSKVVTCNRLLDIIITIDTSGSVGPVNNDVQKTFAAKIARHFTVGPNSARFGVIVFSNNATKFSDLKDDETSEEVARRIELLPYFAGSTFTNKALEIIRTQRMFSTAAGGRDAALDVVIVLTDGLSSSPPQTQDEATKLKNSNVEMFSVGIGAAVSQTELNILASSRDNVFLVTDFESLDYIEQAVSRKLCQLGL